MIYSRTVLIVSCFALLGQAACTASSQETISSYEEAIRRQGNCHAEGYNPDRCQEVVKQLEKALAVNPTLVEAYLVLSTAYWNRAMERTLSDEAREALRKKAEDTLRKATSVDPGNVKANWSLIWFHTDDLEERLALARKFVAAAPDQPDSHYTLAELLLRADKIEEAVAAEKRSMELRATLDIHEISGHWYTARDLTKQGNLEEAVEVYEAIFAMYKRLGSNRPCPVFRYVKPEQFKDFPEFREQLEELYPYCKRTEHADRAQRLQIEGKNDEAIRELELELKESPFNTRAYSSLARLYAEQGETERARDAVRKFVETEKDPGVRCRQYVIMERLRFQEFAPEPMAKLQKECEAREAGEGVPSEQ